jgi:hypothetical protein
MTIQQQYSKYMEGHKDSSFTFNEWKKEVYDVFIEDAAKQISNLPPGYTYRPLPTGLFIGSSNIEGQGLFSSISIPLNINLGITHTKAYDELIRRGLGSFINHSITPNCKITDMGTLDKPHYYLITIRDIQAGEELTVDYYKAACGNEALFELK